MANRKGQSGQGPMPPAPNSSTSSGSSLRESFGAYKKQEKSDFVDHASEVQDIIRGRDIVENRESSTEKKDAAFEHDELQVVRSWVKKRPLEAYKAPSALVAYPRLWNTRRGRYTRFALPGAGAYGLLRARPSF
jgi:hypothetical protein